MPRSDLVELRPLLGSSPCASSKPPAHRRTTIGPLTSSCPSRRRRCPLKVRCLINPAADFEQETRSTARCMPRRPSCPSRSVAVSVLPALSTSLATLSTSTTSSRAATLFLSVASSSSTSPSIRATCGPCSRSVVLGPSRELASQADFDSGMHRESAINLIVKSGHCRVDRADASDTASCPPPSSRRRLPAASRRCTLSSTSASSCARSGSLS